MAEMQRSFCTNFHLARTPAVAKPLLEPLLKPMNRPRLVCVCRQLVVTSNKAHQHHTHKLASLA